MPESPSPPGRPADVPGCPDPALLAGFAGGSLLEAEQREAEAHLARCEACCLAVANLARDAEVPLPIPLEMARPRGGFRWASSAAAAVLLVAGLAIATLPRGRAPDGDGALVAAARDLSARRPGLFAGFRPLDREERLAPSLHPKRGGAVGQRYPCGSVIEDRPRFLWEAVDGVERWRVTLSTSRGDRIWTAESADASLDYPAGERALRPGEQLIWEVAGEGPLGPEGARRTFEVAGEAERLRFEEGRRALREDAPPRLRPLLEAHWALRAGHFAEAEAPAREALAADPSSTVARETLRLVLETLGE